MRSHFRTKKPHLSKLMPTLAVVAMTLAAIPWTSASAAEIKLTASDAAANDQFGRVVDTDGTVMIVGATNDDDNGFGDSGSAYVFRWNGTSWIEEQKLLPSDPGAGDEFGRAVAIDGDIAVVGAHQDDDQGTDAGSAYIFRFDGQTWNQEAKLAPPNLAAGDAFGHALSISGETIFISAFQDDHVAQNAGSVYVFNYDDGTSSWIQDQHLTAFDAAYYDWFGYDVDVRGDVAIIGARLDDLSANNEGSAYIYRRDQGIWTFEQKLTASDAADGDEYGFSVGIEANLALVGAPRKDDKGSNAGGAYVYRFNGTSWTEEHEFLASDGAVNDRFGFGVALDAGIAFIGAPADDDMGTNSGSAYVFHYENAQWSEEQKLVASDGSASNDFGRDVALHSGRLVSGARFNLSNGAVYENDLAKLQPELLAAFPCDLTSLADRQDVALFKGIIHDGSSITFDGEIIGRWCDNLEKYIPYKIIWNYANCTATGYHDPYLRCETLIEYPIWDDLQVSFSMLQLNDGTYGDSFDDLVFTISGTDNSGITPVETGRVLAIFAQEFMAVETWNLAGITPIVQDELFYAMDFRTGHELTDPAVRDFTGKDSYRVQKVNFKLTDTPNLPPPPPVITAVSEIEDTNASPVVRIYPNPAGGEARIEAQKVAPGHYTIELVAGSGRILESRELTVDQSGEFMQAFNLTDLPAGYYIAKIHAEGLFIGAYPVVVLR